MTSSPAESPADPPEWFTKALATAPQERRVDVDGTAISYLAWGDPSARGLVLVHGGGAHAHWWDHIAPLLALDRRVVALDLSGHGDSDRRDTYTLDAWATEVLAVAADAGLTEPPTVIGHSMGGLVTLRLAGLHGARLAGAVVIDAPVRDRDLTPEELAARERRAFGPLHVYPSREDAIARFRTIPPQETLPYAAAHVAATSVRPAPAAAGGPAGTGDGWTWKFDPRIFGREPFGAAAATLTRLDCRVALFRAEHGIMSAQMSQVMYDRLGRVAPVIEIPAAAHHIMLDQPVALIAALRTLLSDWDHSRPPSI
ncbi:MAG TPA: alpha/beta hydrolase [Streptosporangiaceae bacterium]